MRLPRTAFCAVFLVLVLNHKRCKAETGKTVRQLVWVLSAVSFCEDLRPNVQELLVALEHLRPAMAYIFPATCDSKQVSYLCCRTSANPQLAFAAACKAAARKAAVCCVRQYTQVQMEHCNTKLIDDQAIVLMQTFGGSAGTEITSGTSWLVLGRNATGLFVSSACHFQSWSPMALSLGVTASTSAGVSNQATGGFQQLYLALHPLLTAHAGHFISNRYLSVHLMDLNTKVSVTVKFFVVTLHSVTFSSWSSSS